MQAQLEFGWFLPTSGDTTCYGDRHKFIEPSAELFDRVALDRWMTRSAVDAPTSAVVNSNSPRGPRPETR